MGLDLKITGLVSKFYSGHEKWFEQNGAVAEFPTMSACATLQGCAFSMLLLAGQATCWIRGVRKAADIKEASISVDDRGIILEGSKAAEKLAVVTADGDMLDKMMQWTKHPDKLQCFGKGRGNLQTLSENAAQLGPLVRRFKFFGVDYLLEKRKVCVGSRNDA